MLKYFLVLKIFIKSFKGKGPMQTYWLRRCEGYYFDNIVEDVIDVDLFDGTIFPRITKQRPFNSILCKP